MKYRIKTVKCREGDILVEDIFNDRGLLLLTKNTVLNKYIKQRLMNMEIDEISVYRPEYVHETEKNYDIYEDIAQKHAVYVMELKELIHDLSTGKALSIEKIDRITDGIYQDVMNQPDMITFLNKLQQYDDYTYSHSINVGLYSMLIGTWLNLSQAESKDLIRAGLLHDIGKTKVSAQILNKPTRLLDEEFEEIKKHTLYGYSYLEILDHSWIDIKQAALMHHERENGTGYPNHLTGKQISLYAKIISISDVFDAMTSDRVYKKGKTPFEAFAMFQTEGISLFDMRIVNTFINNMSTCFFNSKVLLNNGHVGEVVYASPYNPGRPVVRVDSDYMDLSSNRKLYIASVL